MSEGNNSQYFIAAVIRSLSIIYQYAMPRDGADILVLRQRSPMITSSSHIPGRYDLCVCDLLPSKASRNWVFRMFPNFADSRGSPVVGSVMPLCSRANVARPSTKLSLGHACGTCNGTTDDRQTNLQVFAKGIKARVIAFE